MKSYLSYDIFNNGDSAITIQFSKPISEQLSRQIVTIEKQIKNLLYNKLQEVILGYQSITLCFDPLIANTAMIKDKIEEILSELVIADNYASKLIEIPVCYEQQFAPDLAELATYCNLPVHEVIEKHTEKSYLVHMLGFLPGFLYLGGLTSQLFCPRKNIPSTRVTAGSIAIGGEQTGIYPVDSPGGWHVIGQTPLIIFNPNEKQPTIASPLDRVKFISISCTDFFKLKNTMSVL